MASLGAVARRNEPQPALAAAVRQLRLAAGMTQEDLGREADVHPTRISRLESGHENPTWGTVTRVALALGVPLSDLARLAEELGQRRTAEG